MHCRSSSVTSKQSLITPVFHSDSGKSGATGGVQERDQHLHGTTAESSQLPKISGLGTLEE